MYIISYIFFNYYDIRYLVSYIAASPITWYPVYNFVNQFVTSIRYLKHCIYIRHFTCTTNTIRVLFVNKKVWDRVVNYSLRSLLQYIIKLYTVPGSLFCNSTFNASEKKMMRKAKQKYSNRGVCVRWWLWIVDDTSSCPTSRTRQSDDNLPIFRDKHMTIHMHFKVYVYP